MINYDVRRPELWRTPTTSNPQVREVIRRVIDPNPAPRPGLIAGGDISAPILTQPEGEALSEFILMVGSHKAAIRMVQGK